MKLNETTIKCRWRANIKNVSNLRGDMIRVRCPYTGVWIMKESNWVTL